MDLAVTIIISFTDYWSNTTDRGSSLPLTTLAVVDSLLEWGIPDLAKQRLGYYFDNYIFENGTIDLFYWKVIT